MKRAAVLAILISAFFTERASADYLNGYVNLMVHWDDSFESFGYADYNQTFYFGLSECYIDVTHMVAWDPLAGPAGLIEFAAYYGKHYEGLLDNGAVGQCGTTYRARVTANGSRPLVGSCLSNAWGSAGVTTEGCGSSGCGDCGDNQSPIIIGFGDIAMEDMLSGPEDPVLFDLDGRGHAYPITWSRRGAAVGFLIFDRNGDGYITSGAEMFGNFTPLADGERTILAVPSTSNGYLALGMYDRDLNGGNSDGKITASDAVWQKLKVWIDKNHDGVSQPEEIKTLDELGITEISYSFTPTRVTDRSGNLFRYEGYAIIAGQRVPTYDVFFQRLDTTRQGGSERSAHVR